MSCHSLFRNLTNMNNLRYILIALGLCACVIDVKAEVAPQALPTDSRLVQVKYNPAQIVSILTAPGYLTHIELEVGEKLKIAPALGDSVQWEVEDSENHVFLKPDLANITTNLTLVTNKRTYQFNLIASAEGGFYYQHVKFKYSDSAKLKIRTIAATEEEAARVESQTNFQTLDPTSLNSNYKISGSAKFRPDYVQDDGKFTYIKIPVDVAETPIVYIRENGNFSQVNYSFNKKTGFFKVTRLADEFVLVLDKEEVVIKKRSGFW